MVGIVFLHHQVDAITENNLKSFRDWNPEATIVTVSAGEPFPGGYSIRDLPQGPFWEEHNWKWKMQSRIADVLLYSWYLNRREHCDRWVVVEWDAYCGMPVEKFFEHVWDFDLVAASTRWPHRDWEWFWFSTVKTLPDDLQPFALGLVPFCFLMMKDHVLSAVCDRVPWEHLGCCNAELRFGTLACAAGFGAVSNPLAQWNISSRELPEHSPVHQGMWHPVKWLVSSPAKEFPQVSSDVVDSPEGVVRKISQWYVEKLENNYTSNVGSTWRHVGAPGLQFYNMGEMLQWLVHRQSYTSYLELTARPTSYFHTLSCATRHRVDVSLERFSASNGSSEANSYLASGNRYDLILIDGCRDEESLISDLRSALDLASSTGTVVCFGPLNLGNGSDDSNNYIRKSLDCLGVEFPRNRYAICRIGADVGIIQINHAHQTGSGIAQQPVAQALDSENLGSTLFPWAKPEVLLTVVTLWDGKWTSEQEQLLNWYSNEAFPPHTHFVWATSEDSETETLLEYSWPGMEKNKRDCSLELVVVPDLQQHAQIMRHRLKAEVYSEVIRSMGSEYILFINSNILPTLGATNKLIGQMSNLPESAASIAGVSRSRMRPDTISAGSLDGAYLRWEVQEGKEIVEVAWSGDGFSLYKTALLIPLLPLACDTRKGISGWEFSTGEELRKMGKSLFIDCGLRLENRAPQVQIYLTGN